MAKTATVILSLLGLGAVAAIFWPKTAKASELGEGQGPVDDGTTTAQPQNAQEAYGLAMNPNLKDPDQVHNLAVWLSSSGQRPDWGAAAERRAQDLRAEIVLGGGLKQTADASTVATAIATLSPTHTEYADVLRARQKVEAGQAAPAPFVLQLRSGGSITIDLSVYRPNSPGAGGSVATTPGGTTTAKPPAVVVAPPVAPQPAPPPTVTQATPAPPVVSVPASQGQPAAPPLAQIETQPDLDPNGTVALGRMLLDEQSRKGWKSVSEAVKAWQVKVGLTPDGKFGPGAALRMAEEVGVLPWVRYWPLGSASKSAAVNDYRGRLKAVALRIQRKAPEQAAALLISAERETGQGWPQSPSPAPAQPVTAEQIASLLQSVNTMAAAHAGKAR